MRGLRTIQCSGPVVNVGNLVLNQHIGYYKYLSNF